jgi:hypothetical protein
MFGFKKRRRIRERWQAFDKMMEGAIRHLTWHAPSARQVRDREWTLSFSIPATGGPLKVYLERGFGYNSVRVTYMIGDEEIKLGSEVSGNLFDGYFQCEDDPEVVSIMLEVYAHINVRIEQAALRKDWDASERERKRKSIVSKLAFRKLTGDVVFGPLLKD